MKVLQVIESAYRCTIEEQDDPAIWITHAMKGAGGDLDVLLRGNCVNYVVDKQDASGLCFGDCKQTKPPQLARDIAKFMDKEMDVYVIDEDINCRGISANQMISGIKTIAKPELANLFERYDQVWHW